MVLIDFSTPFVVVSILLFFTSEQCLISGRQIGVCEPKTLLNQSSFCYDYISSFACMPEDRKTWNQYNEIYRDQLIEEIFMKNLEKQLVAQYQDPWTSNIVSNNLQCYYAYRKFLCVWNFPECDSNTKKTKALCKSYCASFFSSCSGNAQICDVVYGSKDLGLDANC